MADIDSLKIQVEASAENASKGLDDLANSLGKLRNSVKGGLGLNAVIGQMDKLAVAAGKHTLSGASALKSTINALNGLSSLKGLSISTTISKSISDIGDATTHLTSSGIEALRDLSPALSSLSSVNGLTVSATIGKGIAEIATATKTIDTSSLGNIAALANAVAPLSQIKEIKISSTLAKNIIELGVAAEQIRDIPYEVFGNLAEAIVPLSQIESATGLRSTLTQLSKIPEITKNLSSAEIERFSDAVKRVVVALEPLAGQMSTVAAGFSALTPQIRSANAELARTDSSTRTASTRYTELYSKVRLMVGSLQAVGRVIAGWINESNQYIEDMNLFTVSMGEYAESAQKFATKVGEVMGIDPAEWMRTQGIFMTLSKGFGVAEDRASKMSQQLTQLGYDLSSFFNIDVQTAMQKLQSGLAGELEPLRRLGFDLSEARLKAIALSLGIDQTYKSMTQAQKAQLRYYAVMTQVTDAQGDMARTLSAPANQMRILQAQVTQAARALGNTFIPILNNLLPYVIAATRVVRQLAEAFSAFLGLSFTGSGGASNAASSVNEVSDAATALGDNLDGARSSAKELKSYLMGFDELNVIDPTAGGNGGGGGGGGDLPEIPDDWDFPLPEYDFLGDLIETRVDEIMRKVQPFFDWMKEHMDTLIALGEVLAATFLMLKLRRDFLPNLKMANTILGKMGTLLATAAVAAVSVVLTYTFDNQFIDTGNAAYLIGDALSTALGATIVKGSLTKLFGKSAGWYGASAYLAISAGTSITAMYNGISEKGWDKNSIITGIGGVLKGAFAGAGLAFALGASVVGGAVVGGVLTLAIAAGVAIAAWDAYNIGEKIKWGERSLTPEQMKEFAEAQFSFDITAKINSLNTKVENIELARQNLIKAKNEVTDGLTSLLLTPEIEGNVETLASQAQTLVDALNDSFTADIQLAVSFAGTTSSAPTAIEGYAILQKAISSAGEKLSTAFKDAMSGGLSEANLKIIQEELEFLNQLAEIESRAGFKTKFDLMNVDWGSLDKESFYGSLGQVTDLLNSAREAYDVSASEYYNNLVTESLALQAYLDTLDEGSEEYATTLATIDRLNKEIENFDAADYVQNQMETLTTDLKPLLDRIGDIYRQAFDSETWSRWTRQSALARDISKFLLDNTKTARDYVSESGGLPKVAEQIAADFVGTLQGAFDEEEWQELVDLKDALGVDEWQLVAPEVQQMYYDTLVSIFGGDTEVVDAIFKQNGWVLGDTIIDGITDGITDGETGVTNSLDKVVADINKNKPNVSVKVNLLKSGWATVSDFIGKITPIKVPLSVQKVKFSTTWSNNGAIKVPTSVIPQLYADGGLPPKGQLFIAREGNGAEMVGSIGSHTAVANNDQIVEAVSDGVYRAVVSAMNDANAGDRSVNVYLDGEKLYQNQRTVAARRGYDLGMGGYSNG